MSLLGDVALHQLSASYYERQQQRKRIVSQIPSPVEPSVIPETPPEEQGEMSKEECDAIVAKIKSLTAGITSGKRKRTPSYPPEKPAKSRPGITMYSKRKPLPPQKVMTTEEALAKLDSPSQRDVTVTVAQSEESFLDQLPKDVSFTEETSSFFVPVAENIPDDEHVPWQQLHYQLAKKCLQLHPVRGDGFCFLYSVYFSLWGNHLVQIPLDSLIARIMNHILDNSQRYGNFGMGQELLIKRCTDFFLHKDYNNHAVDIIVQATAEALGVGLDIYEEKESHIFVVRVRPQGMRGNKVLPLVYHHNPMSEMLGHYEAVVPLNWKHTTHQDKQKFDIKSQKQRFKRWKEDRNVEFFETSPPKPSGSRENLNFPGIWQSIQPDAVQPLSNEDADNSSHHGGMVHTHEDDSGITDLERSGDPVEQDVETCSASEAGETTFQPEDEEEYLCVPDSVRLVGDVGRPLLPSKVINSPAFQHGGHDIVDVSLPDAIRIALAGEASEFKHLEVVPDVVSRIPEDIDGHCIYIVPQCAATWKHDTADLRHFKMNVSRRQELYGYRKTGTCQGYYICPNNSCGYLVQTKGKQPNRTYWVKGAVIKTCRHCGELAQRKFCGARKVLEYHFREQFAIVWHYGHHTCVLKHSNATRKRAIEEKLRQNPKDNGVSVEQYGISVIMNDIKRGDLESMKKDLRIFSDPTVAKRVIKSTNEAGPILDNTSWDAVAQLKAIIDQHDTFLIYRVNNSSMNHTSLDYVFKSSRRAAKVALEMNAWTRDDSPYCNTAYFDVKHQRALGFKTLAMWTYHPLLQRTYRLAVMEIRAERTEHIKLFFHVFNEMLQELTGDKNTTFNPRYFMADHAGCNIRAIEAVFGKEMLETRYIGCGLHFIVDAQRKSRLIRDPMDRERFNNICKQLLASFDKLTYNHFFEMLGEFVLKHPVLDSWAKWWVARQCYTFGPFRDPDASKANLSEAGNASLSAKGVPKALVDVCTWDVTTMMMMDQNLDDLESQRVPVRVGRGPSAAQLSKKDREAQKKRAERYGENILYLQAKSKQQGGGDVPTSSSTPVKFTPHKNAKHRPPFDRDVFPVQGRVEEPFQDVPPEMLIENISSDEEEQEDALNVDNVFGPPLVATPPGRGRGRGGTRGSRRPGRGRGSRGRGSTTIETNTTNVTNSPVTPNNPSRRRGTPASGNNPSRGRGTPGSAKRGRPRSTPQRSPRTSLFAVLSKADTKRQITLAETVLCRPVPELNKPRWRNQSNPNPPTLLLTSEVSKAVRVCFGCSHKLDIKAPAPHDLLLRMKGSRPYKDKEGQMQPGKEGNVYFHLDWRCIQKKHPEMEPTEITCSSNTFGTLTQAQMEFLEEKSLLEPLVAAWKYD